MIELLHILAFCWCLFAIGWSPGCGCCGGCTDCCDTVAEPSTLTFVVTFVGDNNPPYNCNGNCGGFVGTHSVSLSDSDADCIWNGEKQICLESSGCACIDNFFNSMTGEDFRIEASVNCETKAVNVRLHAEFVDASTTLKQTIYDHSTTLESDCTMADATRSLVTDDGVCVMTSSIVTTLTIS